MFLSRRDVEEAVREVLLEKDKDQLRAADLQKQIVKLSIEAPRTVPVIREELVRPVEDSEHKG